MTDANIILVVGSVDCNDGVNTSLMAMTLGKPARTAEEYGGPQVDIARVGSVDTSQLVESRFTVEVESASVDAVSAIVASIASEIRDLADITVGLKGSAYVGTLKVRIGECIEIPFESPMDSALMNAHWTRIEIVVRRDPYVFGSSPAALIDTSNFAPPMTIPTPLCQVICDGNSMTIGHPYEESYALDPTAPYPARLQALLAATWLVRNDGVDSQDIDSMAADAATQIDPLYDAGRPQNVVVCWEGTNEIYYHDDGASAATKLAAYCAARQAAGFKVVILTVLPRSGGATPADFETQRGICNTAIRANWATYADALCDVAADARIGDAGDEMGTTYYGDRVHLTKAGYWIIAEAVYEAMWTIGRNETATGWSTYWAEAPDTVVMLEGGPGLAGMQHLRLDSGNGLSGAKFILYGLTAAGSIAAGESLTVTVNLIGAASGVVTTLGLATRSIGAWDPAHETGVTYSAPVTFTGAEQQVSLTLPAVAALSDYAEIRLDVSGIADADHFYIKIWGVTLTRTPVYAPCVIPLAKVGQFDAPLDLLLDAGALELSACYVAHTANEAAVLGDFITHAVTGMTWAKTGGGAATGTTGIETHGYPNGVGNTAWLTQDAIGDTASVDVTDLLPGEYLVFANVRYETGVAGVEIRQEYGQWTPITTSGLRLLPLGVVSLPTQFVRGSASATLDVSIRGSGANFAVVNYVALLPVSRGLTGWQVTSGHTHRVLWTDGTMYVEDVAKLNEAYGSGVPLRVLGGQLVVLAEQATPAPTTPLFATASATPRWEQFPSL